MLKITSKENTRLRRLSRLYASGRERRENGLFVLEGVRLVCDAVENGVPVLAAALEDDSLPVEKISLRGAAVAVGNEGAGLSGEVIERCSGRVILPMEPGCESLNAAAAASVFAWELYRAKRGLRV